MAIGDFAGSIQNITVLPSAAQTTTVTSATFTNTGYKGCIIYWNITAFSGTSLQLQLVYIDSLTGVTTAQNVGSARTSQNGMNIGIIYPENNLVTLALTPLISPLPANFAFKVVHTAATATYSISIDLIP